MTARLLLRDGENLSEQQLRRLLGRMPDLYVAASGLGTGYASGTVGLVNKASPGTDPDHFAIRANGTNLTLTMRPGYATIQRDAGTSSFDPQGYFALVDAPLTVTLTNNTTGSTRNDTIALRIDQSIAPDSTGTNLVTLTAVAGATGGGLSNAPTDGALYFPLATVAVANGATLIAQSSVTDKRTPYFSGIGNYKASMYLATSGQAVPTTGFNTVAYDTIASDPNGNLTTGAFAHYTAPLTGEYLASASALMAGGVAGTYYAAFFVNGNERRRTCSTGNLVAAGAAGAVRLSLTAGDSVGYSVQSQNTGNTITGGASITYFDICLLKS